jgi:hypothetical protein
MPDHILICSDGDWSYSASTLACTGTVIQQVNSVSTEPTPADIATAFGSGFFVFLPLFALVWGAKNGVLYFLR